MVIPLMKAEMDYIKGGIQEESLKEYLVKLIQSEGFKVVVYV